MERINSLEAALYGVRTLRQPGSPALGVAVLLAAQATLGAVLFTADNVLGNALLAAPFSLLASAALLRWQVRSERAGPLGLALGADEARLIVVGLVIAAVSFIGVSIAILAAMLLRSPTVGLVAAVAWLVFVSVRFLPAMAATIGERAMIVRGAWTMTGARVRGLISAFLLTWLFILIGSFIVAVIVQRLLVGFGLAEVIEAADGQPAQMVLAEGARANPMYWLLNALAGIAFTPLFATHVGVGAYVYRSLGSRIGLEGGDRNSNDQSA